MARRLSLLSRDQTIQIAPQADKKKAPVCIQKPFVSPKIKCTGVDVGSMLIVAVAQFHQFSPCARP